MPSDVSDADGKLGYGEESEQDADDVLAESDSDAAEQSEHPELDEPVLSDDPDA